VLEISGIVLKKIDQRFARSRLRSALPIFGFHFEYRIRQGATNADSSGRFRRRCALRAS
jgi:hypothetical protein